MFNSELVKMNAYLPVRLAELAKIDKEKALEILNAWGEGTKPIKVLWKETVDACEALTVKN